jgi:hypothetical protein
VPDGGVSPSYTSQEENANGDKDKFGNLFAATPVLDISLLTGDY